jgi:hypothetical protein
MARTLSDFLSTLPTKTSPNGTEKLTALDGSALVNVNASEGIARSLETLEGEDRLDVSAVKGAISEQPTGEYIRDELESLSNEYKLSGSAIKDIPARTVTATYLVTDFDQITYLSGTGDIEISPRGAPSVGSTEFDISIEIDGITIPAEQRYVSALSFFGHNLALGEKIDARALLPFSSGSTIPPESEWYLIAIWPDTPNFFEDPPIFLTVSFTIHTYPPAPTP